MRLYRLEKDIEYPERSDEGVYLNIRSIERIDVRPDEERFIRTGFRVSCKKSETIYVISKWGDTNELGNGDELVVKVYNTEPKSLLIYPGSVVGKIVVDE